MLSMLKNRKCFSLELEEVIAFLTHYLNFIRSRFNLWVLGSKNFCTAASGTASKDGYTQFGLLSLSTSSALTPSKKSLYSGSIAVWTISYSILIQSA